VKVELPLITRTALGRIIKFGDACLRLANRGGAMEWLDANGNVNLSATLFATLKTPQGTVCLQQERDTDPRLIICEQGAVRTVFRTLFNLYDPQGNRWGEGMADWTLYANNELYGVVAVRVHNVDEQTQLINAGLRFNGGISAANELLADNTAFKCGKTLENKSPWRDESAGMELTLNNSPKLAVICRPSGASKTYENGKGHWQGFGDFTPYYEDWGTLPDQGWGETSGWNFDPSGGIHCCAQDKAVTWKFADAPQGIPIPPFLPLQGQVLITPASNKIGLASAAQWRKPAVLEVSGGAYRGLSVCDNTHLIYAPDNTKIELNLPSSDAVTTLQIYGLKHWGAWKIDSECADIGQQLINDGRGTDDPNGLQLCRFDDRHGPISGCVDAPANRLYVRIPAHGKPCRVSINAVEGVALSYLRWDDRQTYLVQSSANTKRNLMEINARDGKLRQLVAPHSCEPAVEAMPMYWYECNTPTPYLATEELTRWELNANCPAAIKFKLYSRNRYGVADAVYAVTIPFDKKLTIVDVIAELSVNKRWYFKDLQLLNLFPERFRDANVWPCDYAYVMNSAGEIMLKHPRVGKRVVSGPLYKDYQPPLFMAYFNAARGNILFVNTEFNGPIRSEHWLCPHWIDAHFHAIPKDGKLEAGDKIHGAYKLVIDDGRARDAKNMERVARAVIGGEDLTKAALLQ
jgi:hypothetical protein